MDRIKWLVLDILVLYSTIKNTKVKAVAEGMVNVWSSHGHVGPKHLDAAILKGGAKQTHLLNH